MGLLIGLLPQFTPATTCSTGSGCTNWWFTGPCTATATCGWGEPQYRRGLLIGAVIEIFIELVFRNNTGLHHWNCRHTVYTLPRIVEESSSGWIFSSDGRIVTTTLLYLFQMNSLYAPSGGQMMDSRLCPFCQWKKLGLTDEYGSPYFWAQRINVRAYPLKF